MARHGPERKEKNRVLILNQLGTGLYDSNRADHYFIAHNNGTHPGHMIFLSQGRDIPPFALGRYPEWDEARDVLRRLSHALMDGTQRFEMPQPSLPGAEMTERTRGENPSSPQRTV